MYCNPDQKLIARKAVSPRIESRIEPLINGFAFKSASKYLFIPIELDCSQTSPQQLLFAVAISKLRDVCLVRMPRMETEGLRCSTFPVTPSPPRLRNIVEKDADVM